MSELDTRPQEVNITGYGGDTLPIHVLISDAIIAGRTFSAQVRSKQSGAKIDATFGVILKPGVGADIVLSSADAKKLTARGLYEGYWDVQLTMAGLDPVTTLAYGTFTLYPDVTRIAP